MSARLLSLTEWLDAVVSGGQELAKASLHYDDCRLTGREELMPEAQHGAYIPLVSEVNVLLLGFSATSAVCLTLARAMMGMAPDEEIGLQEATEVLTELMNMWAGLVKRRVHREDPDLKIGLPMYADVTLHSNGEELVREAMLGPEPIYIQIIRHQPEA
jgi:Chemotaxis phosphatase CheX